MVLESFNAGDLESFVDSGLQARGGDLFSILIWQPAEDKSPNDEEFFSYSHLSEFYADRGIGEVTHILELDGWGTTQEELEGRSIVNFDLIIVGTVMRDPPWWTQLFDQWGGRIVLITDWAIGHQLGEIDLLRGWEPSRTWVKSQQSFTGVRLLDDMFDDVVPFRPQIERGPVDGTHPLMLGQDTLIHDASGSLVRTEFGVDAIAFSVETFTGGSPGQLVRLADGLLHKIYATSRNLLGRIDVVTIQDNNVINATTLSDNNEVLAHNAAFWTNLVTAPVQ